MVLCITQPNWYDIWNYFNKIKKNRAVTLSFGTTGWTDGRTDARNDKIPVSVDGIRVLKILSILWNWQANWFRIENGHTGDKWLINDIHTTLTGDDLKHWEPLGDISNPELDSDNRCLSFTNLFPDRDWRGRSTVSVVAFDIQRAACIFPNSSSALGPLSRS